jgi:hypothetical protein
MGATDDLRRRPMTDMLDAAAGFLWRTGRLIDRHRFAHQFLKRFVSSGDVIGAALAAWPDETNRLPPQRPRAA